MDLKTFFTVDAVTTENMEMLDGQAKIAAHSYLHLY